MSVIELEEGHAGMLITLEGDTNVISTQLRLLPPSQKIMILPNLMEHLSPESERDAFNARAFIQRLQKAVTQRTKTARSFLQLSTHTQPRIVFAIHGSTHARAICITKISENITNGDVMEAESIFNKVVQDGVTGLMKQEVVEVQEQAKAESGNNKEGRSEETLGATTVEAAELDDALEREAAPSTYRGSTLETIPSRAIALGIPPKSHVLSTVHNMELVPQFKRQPEANDQVPKVNKGITSTVNGNQIVRAVLTMPNRSQVTLLEKRMTFGPRNGDLQFDQHAGGLPHRVGDADTKDEFDDLNLASPDEESVIPTTPGVVYGESCLVDVQSGAPTKSVKRAQSVDKFYHSNARFLEPTSSQTLRQTRSHCHLRERHQMSARFRIERDSNLFPILPRTVVKASETAIKRFPTSTRSSRSSISSSSSNSSTEMPGRAISVDRGTDVGDVSLGGSKGKPFEPVFDLEEDLIIHFTDDNSNEIFESVLESYKNGCYPISPSPHAVTESSSNQSTSSLVFDEGYEPSISPRSISSLQLEVDPIDPEIRLASYFTLESIDIRYDRRHEFDPYAIDDDSYPPDIKRQWPPQTHLRISSSTASSIDLPIPDAQTFPPPTKDGTELGQNADEDDNETAKKFVEFSPINPKNAISVQNSFRHLLKIIFPPSEHYSQYYFPVAPEADRLWKPVFRNDENDENDTIDDEGRTVDQIIAFGCEEGVKKDFFYQVSGQIEKLGSKKNGSNRSGKLDIRYLISNVMQVYSSVPPNEQPSNPHSNPNILAALLIPHIEAFLANNSSTRLLILYYKSSDLPTIFALQNLLGIDLLKIAGILDSLASDPPPIARPGALTSTRPHTPNLSHPLSNEAVANRQQSRLNSPHHKSLDTLKQQVSMAASLTKTYSQTKKLVVSFAKADYLLPSTATDAEITTFLSGISKSLIEKSSFYAPEPEPEPVVIECPLLPTTPFSPDPRGRDRTSGYPTSTYSNTARASKVSRLTGGAATGSTRGGNYPPSINSTATTTRGGGGGYAASTTTNRHLYAASIASMKTTNSERERRQGEKDWENFYVGEEDSEDDAYDRMILGRGMQKIVPDVRRVGQNRNTKKALKWLGLA